MGLGYGPAGALSVMSIYLDYNYKDFYEGCLVLALQSGGICASGVKHGIAPNFLSICNCMSFYQSLTCIDCYYFIEVKGRLRSCGFLRIFTYTDDRLGNWPRRG